MENEEKFVEDTSSTVDTDNTSEDSDSGDTDFDVEQLKEALLKERTAKQQILARAKKAEEQLKALKPQADKPEPKHDYPDVDERILKANGMPDELLKELKTIARARETNLIDAQNDVLFKLIKENFEKETKQKEASLGSSKGSGNAQAKKSPSTPGISRDEHKAMWKQMNS
jgi:L-lactate utilization protein LutC